MSEPLFIDQELQPHFEKIAAPVKLSDNQDQWQMEIASELFKQLPYLADYAVNVILERVSPERGYAFGSAEVANKSESPLPDQPKNAVRIPVIVKDRLLQPADVMLHDGKAMPLSEERLRAALFRSETFELSTRKPTDQGMVDQLYPPLRTNYGYGNAAATGVGMGGFGKQADLAAWRQPRNMPSEAEGPGSSKKGAKKEASLLQAIAATVPPEEIDAFVEKFAHDRELALMTERNPVFKKLAFDFVGAPRVSVQETGQLLVDHIRPSVVQLEKLASGQFLVRWANRQVYLPKLAEASPAEASQMAGADLSNMPSGGVVTVSTEKAKKDTLVQEVWEKIEHYGAYMVRNADTGEDLEGFVLPLLDFEMQPLELYLWTDGQQAYAVQDEIAGAARRDEPPQLPEGQPQGEGCFYFHDPQGAKGLLPVNIVNGQTDESGMHSFQCEDLFGEQLTVTPTPGITEIQEVGPMHYAIPTGMKWLPLQNPIHLVKDPEHMDEINQAAGMPNQVEVRPTGEGEVSLDGAPLDKVARAEKQFLKLAQAEFLLVAMGADPFVVREKLAHAQKTKDLVKLGGLLPITPLALVHKEMTKQAAAFLADFPYSLRRDLVKEAAALADSETVDKVLAMNFLNPENISTFAGYLPELDQASCKLAEMLVASRLGMGQIPEGAVERSMKNLESVISGLRELEQRAIEKDPE